MSLPVARTMVRELGRADLLDRGCGCARARGRGVVGVRELVDVVATACAETRALGSHGKTLIARR
jgi:hypothetical protein